MRAATVLAAGAVLLSVPACGDATPRGNERWVTTQNTTVDIDWDAVGQAYREAEGPEDFERRVNEIYAGDEVISVAVLDVDERTQEVTGFFDKNSDGRVEDPERIFTISRSIGTESAQVQITGHGPYMGYHSPMWNIASGMAMGYMLSRAFSPGYVPMYSAGYVTPPSRQTALATHRDAYRQANPSKFRAGQGSQSGKTYGRQGGNFGGGKPASPAPRKSFGGGKFGRRNAPAGKVLELGA